MTNNGRWAVLTTTPQYFRERVWVGTDVSLLKKVPFSCCLYQCGIHRAEAASALRRRTGRRKVSGKGGEICSEILEIFYSLTHRWQVRAPARGRELEPAIGASSCRKFPGFLNRFLPLSHSPSADPSDVAGPRRPRLYGFHTGKGSKRTVPS